MRTSDQRVSDESCDQARDIGALLVGESGPEGFPSKNMADGMPLASEPTLFTDSITELEISPTKNEKITMSVPQKTVKNRDKLSCLSEDLPFLDEGLIEVLDGRR